MVRNQKISYIIHWGQHQMLALQDSCGILQPLEIEPMIFS
jgi:hypothetical protein